MSLVCIGVSEDLTVAELAKTGASVVGYQGNLVYDTSKPDGTMQKLLDVTRVNALGWKAKTNLAEGIQIAYQDWMSQN